MTKPQAPDAIFLPFPPYEYPIYTFWNHLQVSRNLMDMGKLMHFCNNCIITHFLYSVVLCWSMQTRLRQDIPQIPVCWDDAAVLSNSAADWSGRVGRIRMIRIRMIRSCWSGRPDDWSGGLGCLERKLSWPGWESRDNVLFHMLSLLVLGPGLLHFLTCLPQLPGVSCPHY